MISPSRLADGARDALGVRLAVVAAESLAVGLSVAELDDGGGDLHAVAAITRVAAEHEARGLNLTGRILPHETSSFGDDTKLPPLVFHGDGVPDKEVRDDQVVGLGLVTTKTARVETVAELTRRAREPAVEGPAAARVSGYCRCR